MTSLFIFAPFFLLVIINFPLGFLKGRCAFCLAASLLLAQVLLAAFHPWLFWSAYPDCLRQFFGFPLAVDNLALIMLFVIGIVALVSLLTAQDTLAGEKQKFNFINLLLVALIGMNATVLVTDIFSLYVFIEVTAMASFILIALEKGKFAIEGAFKYLMLSAIASVFMLTSVAFLLLTAGDISFAAVHHVLTNVPGSFFLKLAVGLFLCGLLIKSGVVPFHGWLPDAYSAAPSCVSVLLAGTVTKISGVYILLRLFSSVFTLTPALQNVLLFAGAISIVFAALAALTQDDFKRMLAYSSSSQVGYIILAFGCGTPLAFVGAVFHFFNHAIFKTLLFVNAASLEKRFGTTDINQLEGLGEKCPVTSVTSLVAMLSTAGIPPLSGFWSKLIIVMALFSKGRFIYAGTALIASIITLAYFLSLERRIFFNKGKPAPAAGGTATQISRGLNPAKNFSGIACAEILLAVFTIAGGLGYAFMLNTWFLPLKAIWH